MIEEVSLGTGRVFESSSTCGALGPEQFPGIFSNTTTVTCDSSDPGSSHLPRLLTDTDDRGTFWLSEAGVGEASLSLSLEGFHVLHEVRVRFLGPLPLAVALEVSRDFGVGYEAVRYFSVDCEGDFGLPDVSPQDSGVRPDTLICTSQYSEQLVRERGGHERERVEC